RFFIGQREIPTRWGSDSIQNGSSCRAFFLRSLSPARRNVSIHVLAVAFGFFEFLVVLLGLFGSLSSVLFHNFVEGAVHIHGHALGISADIKVSALLKPLPEFRAVFLHAVLDVNFLFLVARERGGEIVQNTRGLQGLEFLL